MLTCADAPKTLRLEDERRARLGHLESAHMAPLTDLVRSIRAEVGSARGVPFFDPCDGGTGARALFLLEAPGTKATGSGFISRNNPDETAKNSFELHREAGLPRDQVVLWNVVPWYVGTAGKIRAVNDQDLGQAVPHLEALMRLLPALEAVVLVGRKAQKARSGFDAMPVRLFESLHPSPVPIRTRPGTREKILTVWSEVARALGMRPPGLELGNQ